MEFVPIRCKYVKDYTDGMFLGLVLADIGFPTGDTPGNKG